jgi:hypothetical protein
MLHILLLFGMVFMVGGGGVEGICILIRQWNGLLELFATKRDSLTRFVLVFS